jgi:hypothetical protein
MLKETGLIYSSGLDEVHVSDDVRFSLRYTDDDHIARELGPLHQAVPCPARAAEADPDTRERAPRPGDGHLPARPRPSRLGHARRGRRLTPARAITTDTRPVPQAAQ